MSTRIEIDPGICGVPATVCVSTDDQRYVQIDLGSECELMRALNVRLEKLSPIDAVQELGPDESVILKTARSMSQSKGCCEACVVPVAMSKAAQVAAGLALPKDVCIKMGVDG